MWFSSTDNIRLKSFREIRMWLQNDWHAHIAKLPVNQREENSNDISSYCNVEDAYDDEINYFIDSEEESIEKTMKMNQSKQKIRNPPKIRKEKFIWWTA